MNGNGTLRLITRLTGTMATVEIWDDGPGIDPAIQSRIFEPFFTTKAPGRGLGLGLDTASSIVSRHSGFLTVSPSRVQPASRFAFPSSVPRPTRLPGYFVTSTPRQNATWCFTLRAAGFGSG